MLTMSVTEGEIESLDKYTGSILSYHCPCDMPSFQDRIQSGSMLKIPSAYAFELVLPLHIINHSHLLTLTKPFS